jgi:plasmid stabilization system protein ParE
MVLADAFAVLTQFPRIGVRHTTNGRQFIVRYGRGGYAIRYRLYDDRIMVSRIFHTREDR